MKLWLSSKVERVRASFFVLPMSAVAVAIGAALASVSIDRRLDDAARDLPLVLDSTVESARAILSTIAAATISFAGIAFSISLLVIQLGSSQFSPRVVHTLFRDPFNKRIIALVVGTFTYCIVVLRSVRGPLDSGAEAVVPNFSVALALVLGISAILATVAFINHSAHNMDVSEILERAAGGAVAQIGKEWALAGKSDRPDVERPDDVDRPDEHARVVGFDRSGWVQQIDLERLGELVPAGGFIELHTRAGRYAIEDTPMCSVSDEVDGIDDFERAVRSTVAIGASRTEQQDASYGLRQIVDVALRALSPGINDPTTAQDAIFHAAAVLTQFMRRDPPARCRAVGDDGRLFLSEEITHRELVGLTYDEVRRSAGPHPTVCIYLLESVALVRRALRAEGLGDRSAPLEEQARLILHESQRADVVEHDRALVREAFARRFTEEG